MFECGCISVLGTIAYVLLLIGGLNWGLVGAFDFNLVSFLFGEATLIARAVYLLVGLSAVISIFMVIAHYIKKSKM